MATIEQWRKATLEHYKKENLSNKHQMFSQFEIGPLAIEEDVKNPSKMRTTGHVFHNIVSYDSEIFDEEFLKLPGSAVRLANEWPDSLETKDIFIYLNGTPSITKFKKALLEDNSYPQMNLGVDPYSLGLWQSQIFKADLKPELVKLAKNQNTRVFRLTSQPYSMSGASEAQQLATLLAATVQLFEDYEGHQNISEILSTLSFELAVKPNLMASVAKIRALRTLLARLSEIYKVESQYIPVFVVPATRFFSAREPWNNILRLTAVSAAAKMGGADGLVCLPYDLFSKEEVGLRTSRNVPEILELESFLGQVNDPLLGSYSLQVLEDQLLEKAWQLFVEIEKKDGLRSVLRSGWLLKQIEEDADQQRKLFSEGELVITGINDYPLAQSLSAEFPIPHEEDIVSLEDWWIQQHSTMESPILCNTARFIPTTLAQRFEKWQFRSDRLRTINSSIVNIPVFVEDSQRGSAKFRSLKRALSLAGLQAKVTRKNEEWNSPVVAVVASDPEGDFVRDLLEVFIDQKVNIKIWGGIKSIPGFDFSLNMTSEHDLIYEKIFKLLENHS